MSSNGSNIVPLPGNSAVPAAQSGQRIRGVILDETPGAHQRRVIIAIVTTFLLAFTDVGLLASVWNTLLEENPVVGWVMGAVTAVLGAALMWAAGGQGAKAHTENDTMALALEKLTIAVWALIGAAMTVIRWVAFDMRRPGATSEGEINTGGNSSIVEHVIAVALLVLYAGPGIMAYLHAYHLNNPIAAAQRDSHAVRVALTEKTTHLQGRVDEVKLLVARREGEIDQIELTHANALAAAAALAEECKAWARAQMHRHLADPANGGITQRPAWQPAPLVPIPATPFEAAGHPLGPPEEPADIIDDDLDDSDDDVSA